MENKFIKETLLKSLRIVSSRAIIFYVVILALSSMVINYKNIQFQSHLRMLNLIIPKSFAYIVELSMNPQEINSKAIQPFGFFYFKVTQFFPQQADGFNMLGFCYYHLADYKNAIKAYQKASMLEPDFFWHPYNLGLIYFKQLDFKKSTQAFEKAILTTNEETLKRIYGSEAIYRTILNEDKDFAAGVTKRLEAARSQSYQLLVLNYYYLSDYKNMLNVSLRAIDKDPGSASVFYFYAGYAAYELKDYQQAKNWMESCIRLSPGFADAWAYLAESLQALNDPLAQNVFMKAKELKDGSKFIFNKESLLAPAIQYQQQIHLQFL